MEVALLTTGVPCLLFLLSPRLPKHDGLPELSGELKKEDQLSIAREVEVKNKEFRFSPLYAFRNAGAS